MIEKKEQAKAGVTELSEEDLEKAQGGWSWGATNALKQGKKANKPKATVLTTNENITE